MLRECLALAHTQRLVQCRVERCGHICDPLLQLRLLLRPPAHRLLCSGLHLRDATSLQLLAQLLRLRRLQSHRLRRRRRLQRLLTLPEGLKLGLGLVVDLFLCQRASPLAHRRLDVLAHLAALIAGQLPATERAQCLLNLRHALVHDGLCRVRFHELLRLPAVKLLAPVELHVVEPLEPASRHALVHDDREHVRTCEGPVEPAARLERLVIVTVELGIQPYRDHDQPLEAVKVRERVENERLALCTTALAAARRDHHLG